MNEKLKFDYQLWKGEVVRARMMGMPPPPPPAHLAPHLRAFLEIDGLDAAARQAAQPEPPQQSDKVTGQFIEAFRGEP